MVYDSFAVFFEMAPYYNRFLKKSVRNYQNCSELFKIDPFIGELPNEIWRVKITSAFYQGLRIWFHKSFSSVADDRYGRIDKYEERVTIKLTLRSTTLLPTRHKYHRKLYIGVARR